MLQYYTLEQAARLLGMSTEETKGVLDKHKVRAYRDGSNVRYLTSNVEEVARSLGQSSDPGLQLGESTGPKAGTSAAPGKPTADKPAPDVFAFDLGAADGSDQIDLGVPPPAKAGTAPEAAARVPGEKGVLPPRPSRVAIATFGSWLTPAMTLCWLPLPEQGGPRKPPRRPR